MMVFVFSFSCVRPNKNLQVIDDIHQNKLYLVLEYAEGGPIMQTNHRVAIPENQARKHFLEICCGLDYLHYHKVRSFSLPI
jgi:serine/threonine protein kinase